MRIGIDIGGTKIELRALDKANGKELYRQRVPTPKDYRKALETLTGMIKTAQDTLRCEITSVGVGIPGAVAPQTGLIKNSFNTPLRGEAFPDDLSQMIGYPVKVANDANCFALSEATDGAGKGARVVFGAILGTGAGAGIVVDGKLIEGPNRIAGEWGHIPLPWATDEERSLPPCYCGRQGCIETYVSGSGLKGEYRHVEGLERSTHDIVAAAQGGEPKASAAMQRWYERLARSFALVINILDPDVIVVGGGMSNVVDLYTKVPEIWGNYIYSDTVLTQLKPALHGDSSGVRGAAWL